MSRTRCLMKALSSEGGRQALLDCFCSVAAITLESTRQVNVSTHLARCAGRLRRQLSIITFLTRVLLARVDIRRRVLLCARLLLGVTRAVMNRLITAHNPRHRHCFHTLIRSFEAYKRSDIYPRAPDFYRFLRYRRRLFSFVDIVYVILIATVILLDYEVL